MLNIKPPKNNNDLSVIGQSMNITGNIDALASVDILGSFNGDATFDSVNVRESGFIKGNISANFMSVSGQIEGKFLVKNIVITKTGIISGNISYESIVIEDGAVLNCKINKVV